MKAPLIVLEGLDACGKTTQSDILVKNLEKQGLRVTRKQFPGYGRTPAGNRIAAYLRGEIGNLETLDPRMIAALYAADRLSQIDEIEELRSQNDVVILDRGVTSNLIYTPARGKTPEEIAALEAFVEELEYKVFGFPSESLVIFLDASFEARRAIHEAKNRLADLHESDEAYLLKVRERGLERCRKDFRWHCIAVDKNGILRRKEDIAKEILDLILQKIQQKDS